MCIGLQPKKMREGSYFSDYFLTRCKFTYAIILASPSLFTMKSIEDKWEQFEQKLISSMSSFYSAIACTSLNQCPLSESLKKNKERGTVPTSNYSIANGASTEFKASEPSLSATHAVGSSEKARESANAKMN